MEEKEPENEKVVATPKEEEINKFYVTCPHCKSKIEIPKDDESINQCKEYVEESNKKYKKDNIIKISIYKGCPVCQHNLIVDCKKYVEFYSKDDKKSKE